MSTQPVREAIHLVGPDWLWTWSGVCFGYRRGDSLFTCDGIEVGRFSGAEVYGPDGRYLGELMNGHSGVRLITSSYKKSLAGVAFVPTVDRAHKKPADRRGQPLYCGYQDFCLPEIVKAMTIDRKRTPRSNTNEKTIS
jgi:hypothetical protein